MRAVAVEAGPVGEQEPRQPPARQLALALGFSGANQRALVRALERLASLHKGQEEDVRGRLEAAAGRQLSAHFQQQAAACSQRPDGVETLKYIQQLGMDLRLQAFVCRRSYNNMSRRRDNERRPRSLILIRHSQPLG